MSIRGKIAQFGQGAMGEVAGGLMRQFAQNVEQLLSNEGGSVGETPPSRGDVRTSLPAEPASTGKPAARQTLRAEDIGTSELNGWELIVLPLLRKALPTAAVVIGSGVASYLGARIAIGRAMRRG